MNFSPKTDKLREKVADTARYSVQVCAMARLIESV